MAEVEEQTFETFETFEDAPVEEGVESGEVADDIADEDVVLVAAAELPDIKLFGRWSCDDVHVKDMSLSVSFIAAVASRLSEHSRFCLHPNVFIRRTTLPSRRSSPVSRRIRPVATPPSVSARPSARLWSA